MTSTQDKVEIVVSNAGPLMALAKIHALDLLKNLYGRIYTTESVYYETVTAGLAHNAPDALLIKKSYEQATFEIKALDAQAAPALTLPAKIHPVERESIQLALQLKASVLLLDDWDARRVAEANFKALKTRTVVKGTLGVIVTACQRQIIRPEHAIKLLEEIKLRRDIWISAKLCDQVIKAVATIKENSPETE